MAPVADPNGPYTGTVGGTISFDGSGSSDPDGRIVSWQWDFENDGMYDAIGAEVTHTCGAADVYTVKLQVMDNCGATVTATTTVTVSSEDIPEFSTIALPVASILALLFLFIV